MGIVLGGLLASLAPLTLAGGSEAAVGATRRVVVLGDSTGLTLGVALTATSPSGVTVDNRALFGCGLAIADGVTAHPPAIALPMGPACSSSTPLGDRWPALDARSVAATRPGDVVIFVAGPWDVADLEVGGQLESLASPAFRGSERRALEELVAISTAHGARLELFTMPPSSGSQGRWMLYNNLLAAVAADHPRRVSVVAWGRLLSPSGHYRTYVDGVEVKAGNGLHTPAYAPGNPFVDNASQAVAQRFYRWVAPRIWPEILRPPAGVRRA